MIPAASYRSGRCDVSIGAADTGDVIQGPPPLRLAFLTPEYITESKYCGGLANYLGRVTTALAKLGHEIEVFTGSDRDGMLCHHGVTVHRVSGLWSWNGLNRFDRFFKGDWYGPYQDFKLSRALYRRWAVEHRRQPFSLVQTANARASGLWLRHRRDVPVVVRLSSFRSDCDRAAGKTVTRGLRTRWALERAGVRAADRAFAPTGYVARRTETEYGLSRIAVLETPFFNEAGPPDPSLRDAIAAGGDYVLFFGLMSELKGVDVLAEALAGLMDRRADVRAVFVGPDTGWSGGDSMAEHVRAVLARHGDRVRLVGPTPHERLYPLVDAARVVAMPSRTDNMPNACLEAMSMGRVVIATSGTSFEQLIDDGRSGLLVPRGEVMPLAHAVELAWDMPHHERIAVGTAAKMRIGELAPKHAIPKLIAYYRSAIMAHRSFTEQGVSSR